MKPLPFFGCIRRRFAVAPAWASFQLQSRESAGCFSKPTLPTICARSMLRLGKRCE